MKISELMAGVTPNASYEGWVTADDWVLAIDTRPSAEAATEVRIMRLYRWALRVWTRTSTR